LDGELSSFVAIDADRGRRAAEAAAEEELKNGRWRGHLHDVPIAVKKLFNVGNLTATYGSQSRAGVAAAADSEVVRRLRRAGAVIVGLTRSHEFGWGHHDSASKRHRDPQSVESGLHQWRFERRGCRWQRFVPAAVASDTGAPLGARSEPSRETPGVLPN
jgi:aspartyl-tRNA(Asn)/glutamyl-tRNA(Gln) amidotransferase subunit A